jgi:hypothetical protein
MQGGNPMTKTLVEKLEEAFTVVGTDIGRIKRALDSVQQSTQSGAEANEAGILDAQMAILQIESNFSDIQSVMTAICERMSSAEEDISLLKSRVLKN